MSLKHLSLPSIVWVTAILVAFWSAAGADEPKVKGLDLSEQNLAKKNFTGKNLENATFENSDADEAIFVNCFAPGANFRGTDLRGAKLKGANFTGSDFRKAKLTGANIEAVDFSKCNLEGMDFGSTRMNEVTFRGANLRYAKAFGFCQGVDFRGADLRGADLTGLISLSDVTPCKYRGAKYSRSTRLPTKRFDLEAAEMVLTADEVKEEPKEAPKKDDAGKKPDANAAAPGARAALPLLQQAAGDVLQIVANQSLPAAP